MPNSCPISTLGEFIDKCSHCFTHMLISSFPHVRTFKPNLCTSFTVSEAKFPDVTNVVGGITAYAEVDPTVWK